MTRAPALQAPRSSAVWMLAVGQTLVWAGLYYVFAALMLRWEVDTGWSKAELAGAFTLAIVASAIAAPFAGSVIDRGYGRALLSGSALAGGALLALLSAVETLTQFYVVWGLIGVAMAGALYEPCFAYVTRLCGPEARAAITRITLVAGFAGTLSFPLATAMADAAGWRASALAFAALSAGVAAPLFWIGGGRIERGADAGCADGARGAAAPDRAKDLARNRAQDRAETRAAVRAALANPSFWLIAAAFSTMAVNHGLLINHLLAILDARGASNAVAVAAAAAIGPMQVAGRIAMLRFGAGVSSLSLTAFSFAAVGVAALLLLAAGASPLLIALFAAAQGAGYGLTSILRPVVAAEMLGRRGFGAISGLLATPYLAASAAAPLLGALFWSFGGPDAAILFAFLSALAGGIAFAVAALSARVGALQPDSRS